MNAASVDIASYLAAAGLGLTIATNLFVGREEASPDNCVTVFDTPGIKTDRTLDGGGLYRRPAIQIRVRNRDYRAAQQMAEDIYLELLGIANQVIGGTHYAIVGDMQEPHYLDTDESDRHRWIVNFDIQRR
jgi:hypothetical protein